MATASSLPTAPTPAWQVEAARYALLRRLAFAMRHEMVVHLQPIGMMADVMERRLHGPDPELAPLQESLAKMQTLSRAASRSCLDVVTRMAPTPGARINLAEGVQECLAQLRGSLSFQGLTLTDDVAAHPMQVDRAGLRHVLPAALLALTDAAQAPAEITVMARYTESAAALDLSIRPSTGLTGFTAEAPYRLLGWADVEALAAADGIEVSRDGLSACITLPRLPDAAPVAPARPQG